MSRLFSDAKDILESSKFLTGLGHASTQPEGLLGATGTRQTATASVFAVADLYNLENDLAPRWRARASFARSKAAYQKIRQFDTGGGASLWTQLAVRQPRRPHRLPGIRVERLLVRRHHAEQLGPHVRGFQPVRDHRSCRNERRARAAHLRDVLADRPARPVRVLAEHV